MVPSLPDVPKVSNDLTRVSLRLGDAPVVDRRALWFAFFGAPLAWTIDELFAIAFVFGILLRFISVFFIRPCI